MTTSYPDRVWLIPQKFWSATREMSTEEAEKLVERLMFLSEVGDFETLQKFDFILIGQPDLGRRETSAHDTN